MAHHIKATKYKLNIQYQQLSESLKQNPTDGDHAWDSRHMRELVTKKTE